MDLSPKGPPEPVPAGLLASRGLGSGELRSLARDTFGDDIANARRFESNLWVRLVPDGEKMGRDAMTMSMENLDGSRRAGIAIYSAADRYAEGPVKPLLTCSFSREIEQAEDGSATCRLRIDRTDERDGADAMTLIDMAATTIAALMESDRTLARARNFEEGFDEHERPVKIEVVTNRNASPTATKLSGMVSEIEDANRACRIDYSFSPW